MANAFSLTNNGSIPQQSTNSNYNKNISGIVANTQVTPPKDSGLVNNTNSAPLGGQPIKQSGFLPSTPVKSITSTDGTKTDFHAPSTPEVGVSSPSSLKSAGILPSKPASNPQTSTPAPTPVATPMTTTPTNQVQQPIQNTQTQQSQPSTYQRAAQNVLNASQMTPQENYYNNLAVTGQELKNINTFSPYAEGQFYGGTGQQIAPDVAAPDLLGRAAGTNDLASKYANLFGSAAQTGYANSLQQQQLGLSAAENVFGGSQPVIQFGQLTDPYTGRVVGADTSGNNPALSRDVANAVAMVRSGAAPADALASLGGYGQAGVSAFNQALQQANGGSYNPTATNAQVQQNVAQGQKYQAMATDLDTGLKQLDTISNAAVDFITKSGLNSTDSPIYNEPINKYIGSLGNTAAASQASLLMADIKKYTGQILAANTGTIPTDTANTLASIDPSLLNGQQLHTYLDTMRALGGNQLQVLQGQATASYGNSGGYSGTPGSVTSNIPVGAANTSAGSGVNGSANQVAAGAGLAIGSDLAKAASSGANIMSFILGKIF